MVSFVHTADIHLGLQFKNLSFTRKKAMERREELWTTFERIVQYTIDSSKDFLFIAGDLFEDKYFTLGDIKRLRDILARAEDVEILIVAGNHDYMGRDSLYNKIEWTPNITVFNSRGIQAKDFPKLRTRIYGYSWDRLEIREDFLLGDFPQIDDDYNKILILHGDLASKSNYLPLDLNRLRALNMDYVALGHIHKPEILAPNIAYCGSPEPLDFGERGPRGFMEGWISNKEVEIRFVPFSKRKFLDLDLAINANMGHQDILNRIKNLEVGQRQMDFYRLNLKGFRQNDIDIKSLIGSLGEYFYYIEVIDETIPDYDLEDLESSHGDNIIGMFIRTMKDKGIENTQIRESLYIGLEALLKGRVG